MPEIALVKDIMSTNLVTTTPETTLDVALRRMLENNVQRLVVVDPNDPSKLVGILTDRDVRLAADSPIHKTTPEIIEKLKSVNVSRIMTANGLVTVEDTAPILEAVKLMRVSNVGGLPVLDANNKVVGIVTRTDLLDHLIRVLEPLDTTSVEETQ